MGLIKIMAVKWAVIMGGSYLLSKAVIKYKELNP